MERFQVCRANGFGFAAHLGALHFCNRDCLHVSFHGAIFPLHFSQLSKLLLKGLGFGVSVSLELALHYFYVTLVVLA